MKGVNIYNFKRKENKIMDGDLSIIREQGEYMEPVPLTAEESATVEAANNSEDE